MTNERNAGRKKLYPNEEVVKLQIRCPKKIRKQATRECNEVVKQLHKDSQGIDLGEMFQDFYADIQSICNEFKPIDK